MKNVPNILSGLRIFLAPVFVLLYVQDEILYRSLSIAVFAVAAFTDYIDGYIARNFNAKSRLGNFLDPLADKILTFSGFLVLPLVSANVFHVLPIVLIIFRDTFVTLLRWYAERKKQTMQTRNSAKFKTLIQMIFLYAALLTGLFVQADVFPGVYARWIFSTGFFTWALYAVAAVTVYTGIEYIVVNPQLFRRTNVKNA
jgi:CDP-diacylglycerol---glycerol-3-phosphate 3-phosphatidyltransferase